MDSQQPLLSICIPTYNRGNFLRVMLQALLPQVAECGEQVEVWVIDNASTDGTSAVVEESRELGPFQYVRNNENIGPLRNVLKGPVECATGKYVWGLGDHNLLTSGALARVIAAVEDNPSLDVFYANFRCAVYPDHWPMAAFGGYNGIFQYVSNTDIADRPVREWSELIRPESALCTQLYAHIVKRTIWKNFWQRRPLGPDYSNAETTYPHTFMLAEQVFKRPSLYLGEPVVTIFNGAQSWGDVETRSKVLLRGFPELIELFRKHGLTKSKLRSAKLNASEEAYNFSVRLFQNSNPKNRTTLLSQLKISGIQGAYIWPAIFLAYVEVKNWRTLRFVRSLQNILYRSKRYLWHNCRPARWLRRER